MNYLLSIDPGKSTGVALFQYDDDTPAELVRAWQFGDGLSGFLRWWRDHTYEYIEGPEVFLYDDNVASHPQDRASIGDAYTGWWECMQVVAEKFTPLQNKGFSLTLDSVEPLRIEGAMVAMGLVPDYAPGETSWQRPACQVLAGGSTAKERKKNSDEVLKRLGFWRTGKQVNAPDADDVNSSAKHAVYYLTRTLKHRPSLEAWFPDV